MGKGEILENYGAGKYKVKLLFSGRDKLQIKLDALDTRIAAIQVLIDAEEDPFQKQILTMQKQALVKAKQTLENSFGDDPEVDLRRVEFVSAQGFGVGLIGIEENGALAHGFTTKAMCWVSVRDGETKSFLDAGAGGSDAVCET